MRLKHTCFSLLLLILSCISIQAQESLPRTMLWRITPPQGGKPSWLYGTIHVQDRSVFRFTDSLYEALGKADKFAMELDPDTLVQAMFARLSGMKEKDQRRVHDQVDEKTWKELKPYLKKRSGKDPETITMEQALHYYRSGRAPKTKADDMPTIVDLYLSLMARDMGKPVTGLEKFADQSSILDDMDEKFNPKQLLSQDAGQDSYLDEMIKAYAEQDLAKVYQMVNRMDEATIDKLLTQRNRKMAMTMDSMARAGSMFFAVGTGHLPGPEGLIEAMRKRGFVVEPVMSNHRLEADHYVFQHPASWQEFTNAEEGWTVSLPGRPFPLTVAQVVEMTGYFDLATMRFYFLTALPGGDMLEPEQDTMIINGLKRSYEENTSIHIDSTQRVDMGAGQRTWEMMGHDLASGYFLRLRLVMKDSKIFLLFLGCKKQEDVSDASSMRFLASLKTRPVAKGMQWYTDSTLGFSVQVPGKVKKVSSGGNGSLDVYQYICMGEANGMATNVVVVSAGRDYVILSDSTYFRESIENMEQRGMEVLRRVDTLVAGRHAMYLDFRTAKGVRGFENHLLCIRQGGRVYDLLSTESVNHPSPETRQQYFSSLRILDPVTAHWSAQEIPGFQQGIWSPEPWKKKVTDEDSPHGAIYQSFDSAAAITYDIYLDTLNKYVWAPDDTSLLHAYVDSYHFEEQAEQHREYFRTAGGARCVNLYTSVEDSRQVKRVMLCLQGDRMVTAYAYLPDDGVHRPDTDRFFNSAQPGPAADSSLLYTRTPEQLFRALRDTAADIRDTAYDALNDHRMYWPKSMFPTIMEKLLQGFPEDADNGSRMEEQLLTLLGQTADSTTPSLIQSVWPKMQKEQEHLRYRLLELLTGLKTEKAFSTLPVLLRDHLPTEYDAFETVDHLIDTVSLAKNIWRALLPFSGDSLFGKEMYRLHRAMVDSDFITLEEFRKVFPQTRGALQAFERQMLEEHSIPYSAKGKSMFNLLGRLKDSSSRAWLQRWVKSPNIAGRMSAALELAKQDQPVDPAVWSSVAHDKDSRLNLYEELDSAGKLKLFPKEYLNRKSFAESMAWQRAEDEYEPKSLRFLKEVNTEFQGKQRTFLLYKLTVEEDDGPSALLAVVGPYAPGSKDLLPQDDEDVSGIFEEDEYAPGLELRQLAKYLKGFSSEKSR